MSRLRRRLATQVAMTATMLLVASPALSQVRPTAASTTLAPAKPGLAPAGAKTPGAAPVRQAPVRPAAPRPKPRAYKRPDGPLATIDQANAQARTWPTPSAYVNSAVFYDYEPGRIYTIQTSPRFLTTIALRPGEKLISKAAGDTVRWVLGETVAGSGAAEQVVIFVKPIRPDLRTNIVLTTDQRTYLIDSVSSAGQTYTSVLSWNYPQEEARLAAAALASSQTGRVTADVALEQLDFGYRIETLSGRAPPWAPVRVFDDGVKTFIAFPAELAVSQAPPLFLVGDKGRAELVNYRVSGGYYIVDRLIDRAELRLGQKRQTVVRITRARPRS